MIKRTLSIGFLLALVIAVATPPAALAQQDADHDKVRAMGDAVTQAVYSMPDYGAFDWVNISVTAGGEVIITGDAARKRLKTFACDEVNKVDGVTECINNLLYLGNNRADVEIRTRAYQSIYGTYLDKYSEFLPGERAIGGTRAHEGPHPIHIVVQNQKVYLMGWVESAADKASATHATKVVPGVADVVNELTIQKPPQKQ